MSDEDGEISAARRVLADMLEQLASSRPLQGPLSIRFGAEAHEVLDANGEVVAVMPVETLQASVRAVVSARN